MTPFDDPSRFFMNELPGIGHCRFMDPDCKGTPVMPVVDRARCEGKADCVRVCPHDVFEVRRMHDHDFAALGLLGKLKSVAHGRKTAYTPKADACQACGQCVTACPEGAIKLVRRASLEESGS